MNQFKNYIALFLLLLFVRVLLPEQELLKLHSHDHTEHVQDKKGTDFKLDIKHQHCQIDKLFNAPYTPAAKVQLVAIDLILTDTYSANYSFIWKFTFPNNTDLRGPPFV